MQQGDHDTANQTRDGSLDFTVLAAVEYAKYLREMARAFAELHGVDRPEDVELAVAEACANAMVHAYAGREPGPVRLTGAVHGDRVWFTVDDRGRGPVPRPDSPGLGLGLPIMSQLADAFQLTGGVGSGTRVRMEFSAGRRRNGAPA